MSDFWGGFLCGGIACGLLGTGAGMFVMALLCGGQRGSEA